ncbi:MAG: porin family protein [Bacteroidales bacterium]|nr:porin family protein [Bacteroidales bacterium]
MKKIFFTLVAVFALSFAVNAQDNALGVRFGGGQGYGAELSYQRALGSNRLELDLGWAGNDDDHYNAFSLTGVYQWRGTISGNFGWFAGVGAHIGYWNYDLDGVDADIALALTAQAGLEYTFDAVPIQLSLDIRPRFYVIPDTDFHWGDIALGIRYVF